MGAPYQSQSASGYNSSPPPDDGSTVAANKITWGSTIKTKLSDPIKTLADAINTALRAALNITPSTTSTGYTTLVGDHLTTIEVTGTTQISLGDAATMIAQSMGYTVTVYNKGTNTVTVALATNTNKLNGNTNGTMTLASGQSATFTVAQSGTDYECINVSGFATVVLTGAAGTNTATAAAPGTMIGLFAGMRLLWTPANTNTGATTLNITPSGGSALGAKNIYASNAALVGGELRASIPVLLVYDGTQFQIVGPVSKQPTRTVLTSGSGTYTTPTGATRINVRLAGGGGGGGGATANNGTAGNNTTFGTLTGSGGTGGSAASNGGAGGGASGGDINIPGGGGGGGGQSSTATLVLTGGTGGNSALGGGGNSQPGGGGFNGATNSGGGGGGGGGGTGTNAGGGGGGGGYVEKLFAPPSATYSYGVGASANGGAAGTTSGGNGAAGIIIVDEYYN